MDYDKLSPATHKYIKRTYMYDGVIIALSCVTTLSIWGLTGFFVLGIPVSLYALLVGYLCRQHAMCEDECYPYLGIWMISIFLFGMLIKAGGAVDKVTKD